MLADPGELHAPGFDLYPFFLLPEPIFGKLHLELRQSENQSSIAIT
jgi:hypothetical protein